MLPLFMTSLLVLGLESSPESFRVSFKDGRQARVQVLDVEDGVAHLKVFALGGHAEVRRELDSLQPRSAFEVERAASEASTFEEHFALAQKAMNYGLVVSAGQHLETALSLIPDHPQLTAKEREVRVWAANELKQLTAQAIEQNDTRRASNLLEILTTRFAEHADQERLEDLACGVDHLRHQSEFDSQESIHSVAASSSEARDIQKRSEQVRELTERGDERLRRAYAVSASTRESERLSRQAIEDYESAWKLVQELASDYPDHGQLQGMVLDLGQRYEADVIRASLHAASVLTTQTDYPGAEEWVRKVLQIDPENVNAKEMLRHIQLANAAAWPWRWGNPNPGNRFPRFPGR